MEDNFEIEVSKLPQPLPTPTPEIKKVSKKSKPCKDCPDYSKEDLLREKILTFRGKGYNDNQIAAMLMVHKHFVESIK